MPTRRDFLLPEERPNEQGRTEMDRIPGEPDAAYCVRLLEIKWRRKLRAVVARAARHNRQRDRLAAGLAPLPPREPRPARIGQIPMTRTSQIWKEYNANCFPHLTNTVIFGSPYRGRNGEIQEGARRAYLRGNSGELLSYIRSNYPFGKAFPNRKPLVEQRAVGRNRRRRPHDLRPIALNYRTPVRRTTRSGHEF